MIRSLTSIVAMNHDGAIGAANTLPWKLKSDLRFFKETTKGGVVIMGRKTFDSLNRCPLPLRYNVILSHRLGLFSDQADCKAAFSVEEGLWRAENAPNQYENCFLIGGASMYGQFAPFVDRYLITWVNKRVPDADTFFEQAWFGDQSSWEIDHVGFYPADDLNETNFSVFELTTRDALLMQQRRNDAVAAYERQSQASPRARAPSRRMADNSRFENHAAML